MALTNGDKAVCQQIAREIVKEVLADHIKLCPYGRSLLKFICVAIGIALGSGIVGGGINAAVLKAANIL